MEIYGYIASSLMGLTLGLIGAGGSIMIVPILVYLFSLSPLIATTESLFIVGTTALVGSLSYVRRGEVKINAALSFIVPSFAGVYLARVVLLPLIPQIMFKLGNFVLTKALFVMVLFSVLMLAASWSMIRKKSSHKDLSEAPPPFGEKIAKNGIAGFLVGGLTSLIGAGGGFLIIPSLVVLLRLEMREAVGTSLIIIASNSLFGFFSSYQKTVGVMNWQQMLAITGLAIAGIFIGTRVSKKIPELQLKKGFGYFVLLMGIFILIDQIHKL